MLDSQTIATVKSTIPLLAATGPKLTAHFYDRMFAHNPELKDVFNMSNQRNGDQRQALFDAICAYAANIENLAALLLLLTGAGLFELARRQFSREWDETQEAIEKEIKRRESL